MTGGGCVGIPAGGGCSLIIPHSWGSLGTRIKFEGQIRWSKPEKMAPSFFQVLGHMGEPVPPKTEDYSSALIG